MDELELIELINKAYRELERNRSANVSSSLIKLQEEEIKELELIYATGDAERLGRRFFLDQCAEKFDEK